MHLRAPGHQCKNPTVHLLTNEEDQEEEEHQLGVKDSDFGLRSLSMNLNHGKIN
jgi:hypothetical protein